MSRVEKIETEIQNLSPEELADLRAWFAEYDAETWDAEIEADANSGKLDQLADRAI